MRDTQRSDTPKTQRIVLTLATLVVAISMTACSHAMMMIHGTGAKRPAASEFGLGPRSSAAGRHVATPPPAQPRRPPQKKTTPNPLPAPPGGANYQGQRPITRG